MILFVPAIEHQNAKFSLHHNKELKNLLLKSFRRVVKILEQIQYEMGPLALVRWLPHQEIEEVCCQVIFRQNPVF